MGRLISSGILFLLFFLTLSACRDETPTMRLPAHLRLSFGAEQVHAEQCQPLLFEVLDRDHQPVAVRVATKLPIAADRGRVYQSSRCEEEVQEVTIPANSQIYAGGFRAEKPGPVTLSTVSLAAADDPRWTATALEGWVVSLVDGFSMDQVGKSPEGCFHLSVTTTAQGSDEKPVSRDTTVRLLASRESGDDPLALTPFPGAEFYRNGDCSEAIQELVIPAEGSRSEVYLRLVEEVSQLSVYAFTDGKTRWWTSLSLEDG